jgi:hypothetical protein
MIYKKSYYTCVEYIDANGKKKFVDMEYDDSRTSKYVLETQVVDVLNLGDVIYYLDINWQQLDDIIFIILAEKNNENYIEIINRVLKI